MEPEKKSNGALIGSIIVIVILIIGGIYLWKTSVKQKLMLDDQNKVTNTPVDNSINDVEKDLNNMDLEGLDQGI